MHPLVSIQIVVRNGERYLRRCLDAVRAQTYPNYEVTILDNASTDSTRDIIRTSGFLLVEHNKNLGMWPGHEFLLPRTTGEYVLCLSVDVILHPEFVAQAVAACQHDPAIAAIQGKIYQYDTGKLSVTSYQLPVSVIDTCGFALTRARKVVNIGHGEPDGPPHASECDIFAVEGAVPFFRRNMLLDCRVDDRIWDPDYFWYGDDLDLGWRMTLFGYRQRFVPTAIAWHDRSTTKGAARIPVLGQLARLKKRRAIPLQKRRLDWLNTRLTLIKNDHLANLLRHAPRILVREWAVLGYLLLFEPRVLAAGFTLLRKLPHALRLRRAVMARATATATAMRQWIR